MNIYLVLLIVAYANCDVKYHYKIPETSYGVPLNSVGALHYQPNFDNGNIIAITPPTIIQTPFREYHNFVSTTPASIDQRISLSSLPSTTNIFSVSSQHGSDLSKLNTNSEIKTNFAKNEKVDVQRSLYFFSAPEEPEEIKTRIIAPEVSQKKNVRVLFIKAPTFKYAPVEIPLQPQNEEKTLVYVLVKKPEDGQVVVPTQPPTVPIKPEVFFIKYKTQKEAEEAVNNIQEEVDKHEVITNIKSSTNLVPDISKTIQFDSELNSQFISTPGTVQISVENSTPLPIAISTPSVFGVHAENTPTIVSTTQRPSNLNSASSTTFNSFNFPSTLNHAYENVNNIDSGYLPPRRK